jgi:multicomponent Na+:H+ antiporter subunit C
VVYVLCLILLMVGLFGVLTQRNLIKIIISSSIMGYATNLFLILVGYRSGGRVPIMDSTKDLAGFATTAVDPLPQALVLTAIVIELGVLALLVAIALRLYHTYGTYDITEIRKLRG